MERIYIIEKQPLYLGVSHYECELLLTLESFKEQLLVLLQLLGMGQGRRHVYHYTLGEELVFLRLVDEHRMLAWRDISTIDVEPLHEQMFSLMLGHLLVVYFCTYEQGMLRLHERVEQLVDRRKQRPEVPRQVEVNFVEHKVLELLSLHSQVGHQQQGVLVHLQGVEASPI